MSVARGTIQYQTGISPVTGCGFSYSVKELDSALSGPVIKVLYDDPGKLEIKEMIAELIETEFHHRQVERIFSDTEQHENWRVGEALAETYLIHHRGCFFPWPVSRDERKSSSSLPGADLVGFQSNGVNEFFAFGEVKTSAQKHYPPKVMHGNTGLQKQIEDLKDDVKIKDDLVLYLGNHARNSTWEKRYKLAFSNYINNKTNVRVFGFMIRDVKPHKIDIHNCVNKLAIDQHPEMMIELLVLYLPQNSINQLSKKVVSYRKGGVK